MEMNSHFPPNSFLILLIVFFSPKKIKIIEKENQSSMDKICPTSKGFFIQKKFHVINRQTTSTFGGFLSKKNGL